MPFTELRAGMKLALTIFPMCVPVGEGFMSLPDAEWVRIQDDKGFIEGLLHHSSVKQRIIFLKGYRLMMDENLAKKKRGYRSHE